MHLTSALRHQPLRYPKRKGRLVIPGLTQGLPGLRNTLSFVKDLATLFRLQYLGLWKSDYPFVIFQRHALGKTLVTAKYCNQEEKSRCGDTVSFPSYESCSHQGSSWSPCTGRAQGWFTPVSGCLPFQEPQNPWESQGPVAPWGFVPSWKVSKRITMEEWVMLWSLSLRSGNIWEIVLIFKLPWQLLGTNKQTNKKSYPRRTQRPG